MELSQLKQFKEVAESGSVSRAAEKLFISPPAVSKSIRRLEEELGVTLFSRTKNSLTLNEAGKTAYSDVQLLLTMEEKLRDDMAAFSSQQHSVVIATGHPSMIRYLVPNFSMAHPDIQVQTRVVTEDAAEKDVMSGAADLAILSQPPVSDALADLPLETEQLMLYVPYSHPYADRQSLSVKDLDKEPMVFDAGAVNYFQNLLLKIAQREGVEPDILYEKDYFLYRQLMRSSRYIYLGSNISRQYTDSLPNRIYIPLSDAALTLHYHLVYRRDRADKVSSFTKWVQEWYESRK